MNHRELVSRAVQRPWYLCRLSIWTVICCFGFSTVAPWMPARAGETVLLAQAGSVPGNAVKDLIQQHLDRTFDALDELDRHLDRSAFDVTAKARQLAFDPRRMYAFVHEEVTYEPYFGALRGAKGTNQARAGNALDQSLLLAGLLNEAGYRTRIVAGSVFGQDIEDLLTEFLNQDEGPLEEPWEEDVGRAFLAQLTPDNQDVKLALEDRETILDEASMRFWERVDFQKAQLDRLIPTLENPDDPDLRSEAREHYWVRYLDESGIWIDLDPTLPSARFGETPAKPNAEYDELPNELWHRLEVRCTIFVADAADAIEERVVLEHGLRIADVVGQGIVFQNLPDTNVAPDVQDLASWFQGITEFTATLSVGGALIPGKTFDFDGDVYDAPASVAGQTRQSLENATGGAIGVLEQLGAETTAPDDDGKRLVGQRITYALVLPGDPASEPTTTTYSRDVVSAQVVEEWHPDGSQLSVAKHDLLSMTADLLGRVELAPVVGRLSLAYLAAEEIEGLRAHRGLIAVLIEAVASRSAPANLPDAPEGGDAPLAVFGLATETQSLVGSLLGNRFPDVRLHRTEPALIAYETGFRFDGDQLVGERGYDIIHSQYRALEKSNGNSAPDIVRLAGVVETLLELELLRPLTEVSLPKPLGAPEIFEAAIQQGIELTPLSPGHANPELVALAIPEGVKTDIATDLARGYAVIVPTHSPDVDGKARMAWWRVDPASGATLGMMPGGSGGAAEQAELNARLVRIAGYRVAQMKAILFFSALTAGVACLIDSDASNPSADKRTSVMDFASCTIAGVAAIAAIYTGSDKIQFALALLTTGLMVAITASGRAFWKPPEVEAALPCCRLGRTPR